jgi:peptide/nickel transport system substrate-binding protein
LMAWTYLAWGEPFFFLLPPEVIKKYGDVQDWRNVVGTGAFMLTDFVAASSATLIKNPGYWGQDPVGPGKGNQLPYLDGIKILVMPESATQLAAMRTARIDRLGGLAAADAKTLMQSAPDIKYKTYVGDPQAVIAMRTDKKDLPHKDKRVRQALMLATDFQALKNDLYGGEADILAFPQSRAYPRAYMAWEQMPESTQALFRYNPEKARQLLAEAGYPDGFKAKMTVLNSPDPISLTSACKVMWAKVGIDLEVQLRETAAWMAIVSVTRGYDEMLASAAYVTFPNYLAFSAFRGATSGSYVSDPAVETAYQQMQKQIIINMPEADRLHREIMPYIVEQAYYIPRPSPSLYAAWWPWLKNHHGETQLRFSSYYWIDQNLKREMSGTR